MSRAAEDYVNASTHPTVKGATRALLLAIAKHIPEGQTTTPPMTLPDLAVTAHHTGRTAQTCRNLLETAGLVKVHDGGRGNKARYEVLHIDGERPPIAASLPLRADLRDAKVRRTKEQRSTSDLFADNIGSYVANIGSYVAPTSEETAINVGSFFLRSWTVLKKVGSFFLRWRPRTIKERSTSEEISYVHPDRTKEQRSTSEVFSYVGAPTTSSTYRSEEEVPARARDGDDADLADTDAFLAWWTANYPTHNRGALTSVDAHRDGPIVLSLIHPGRRLERLQALALVLWQVTADGRGDAEWIAKSDRSLRVLRHKVNFLERELAQQPAPRDVWVDVLAGIEKKVNRHSFHTWWKDSALVDDRGEVILVQLIGDPDRHELFKDWVQKHYAGVLAESLAAVRPGARVEFVAAERQRTG
jgi:hypothetical protein